MDAAGANILTNGGRVIAVTSFGNTMKDALLTSYQNTEKIHFEGKYFRNDIGFDL
jgi:phosphoribosylamine--glycine ligase